MDQILAYEKYIDQLSIQMIKIEESPGSTPDFLYSLEHFHHDLYKNPEIDWVGLFKKFIQRLEGLTEIINSRITKDLENLNSEKPNKKDEFDPLDLSFEPGHDIVDSDFVKTISEEMTKKRYQTTFSWIDQNVNNLKACTEFFLQYGDEPPFNYPIKKLGKIPFLGGINELIVFFNLLEENGVFFLTDRSNLENPLSNYKNLDSEAAGKINIENAIIKLSPFRIEKSDFLKVISQTFILIDIKGKNLTEITPSIKKNYINLKTLVTKSTPSLAKDISDITYKNFIEGFERIIINLKLMRIIGAQKKEKDRLEKEKENQKSKE